MSEDLVAEVARLRQEASDCRLAASVEAGERRRAHARVAELEAESERLRETLETAAHWHDSERKALSKQPPNTDRDWRRTQHALQAEEIRTALALARGAEA